MTRDDLLAQLEAEFLGGLIMPIYEAEDCTGEFSALRAGHAVRKSQRWGRGWISRYKAAISLPPDQIDSAATPAPAAKVQQPAQPKPLPSTNGTVQQPVRR